MVDDALGAKLTGVEIVNKALGAKWQEVLQASPTSIHTADVPLNPGRHLPNSQVGGIRGVDAIEDHR